MTEGASGRGAGLRELERIHATYGGDAAGRKRACLERLERTRLESARAVLAFHEALCFLRAHPDDRAVLELVVRLLEGFERRADLRRFRRELADTGIAGTDLHYAFYQPQARDLVERHPAAVEVDWRAFGGSERLQLWLEALMLAAETPALDEVKLSPRRWVERMKRPDETDAAFLVHAFDALAGPPVQRRCALDVVDLPFRIRGGAGGPSRTLAHSGRADVRFQTAPLDRSRPDLARAVRERPASIRSVPPARARRLIALACDAMATRARDLDSFSAGSPDDVRTIDLGDGLELVAIGLLPHERLVIEALYGFLTLKNGVPVGYVMAGAAFRSSDVAYNVFETWRGGEAAHTYGRVLAALRAFLGAESFCVVPYQLGHGNEEGLASGAWWFYQKLGFRPDDGQARALMERELAATRRNPRHRSSRATLRRLATRTLYWSPGRRREDVIGRVPMERIALAVTDSVARRFGSARARGARVLAREAAERLGLHDLRRWSRDERRAWERWSPILLLLEGLERWSAADRRALVRVVRAKGGRRETDYLALFERHAPLKRALLRLARSSPDYS